MLKVEYIHDLLVKNLKPIQLYLDDLTSTEIMINPGGRVFVEASGKMTDYGYIISSNAIRNVILAVAALNRRSALGDGKNSIINASFDDYRIAGAIGDVSPDGDFLTIRKHQHKSARPTVADLIERKALSPLQAHTLVDLLIHQHKNVLLAGATGAGKTTIANALLSMVPDHERVIMIEDIRELQLSAPNRVSLLTSSDPGRAAEDLVRFAMRLRPDRLVLGETRGRDTFDLIRAFSSGHTGAISTLHANSGRHTLEALGMLYQQSIPPGAMISPESMMRNIAGAIDVIVFAGRRTQTIDGEVRVVRRVEEILLVKGVKDGEYVYEDACPETVEQLGEARRVHAA